MADFIPVPNVGQFNMCFLQAGQQMQNVYHLRNDSPFDQVSLALASQVLKDWWETEVKPDVSNQVTCTRILARALDNDASPTIEFTNGLPSVGGNAGPALPSNVTIAVKWGTAYAGRSYRGRTFHIGLVEGIVENNQMSPGWATNIRDAYQALLDTLDSTPYELVVVSRYHNNVARLEGIATPISSCSVDPYVDSQRRRLTGRGA